MGERGAVATTVLDSSGFHQLSNRFGGLGIDEWLGISVRNPGGVLVSGQFQGSADFGGGVVTSAGGADLFVGRYADSLGTVSAPLTAAHPGLALGAGEPNPFRDRTRIPFTIDRDAAVTLTVHDAAGRLVRTLTDGRRARGTHATFWDGRNDDGGPVAGGAYWIRLSADGTGAAASVILLR